jgi:hypothetical protein
MKKIVLLTAIAIFSILAINAQEFGFEDSDASPTSFIVMHVEGSAKYLATGSSSEQNVVSGMILPGKGTLTLNKKSQLKLSWKNQTVILSKKGTYSLKNEANKLADAEAGSPAPPTDDFLVALGAASGFGGSGDDGGENRKSGSGQADTLGGSGWGTGKSISPIMPIGGIVPLKSITFSWSGEGGDDGFRVNLYKGADAIFSALTKNNKFTLDVSQLSISEDEKYSWNIENIADSSIKSEKTTIFFTGQNKDKEVIRGMLSDREYSYSDPWLKLLREAHALQKENMLYAADEKYKQGLKDFSDNLTIKKMYAQFLTKYGLGAIADGIFMQY